MKRLRLMMVGLAAAIMLPSVVLAQQTTSKATIPNRCQRFDVAIDLRASSVDSLRKARADTASRIDARLTGLLGRLTVRGLDPAKIKADQAEFDRRAALVDRDYDDLATAVRSAKGACAAAGSLQPARDKLAVLTSDLHDLQNWLGVILRVDILSLKAGGRS